MLDQFVFERGLEESLKHAADMRERIATTEPALCGGFEDAAYVHRTDVAERQVADRGEDMKLQSSKQMASFRSATRAAACEALREALGIMSD